MATKIQQLDQIAISGILASQGFINITALHTYKKLTGYGFFQHLFKILSSPKSMPPSEHTHVVSHAQSAIAQCLHISSNMNNRSALNLNGKQFLFKFLIPSFHHRKDINERRLGCLKKLRENEDPDKQDIALLDELYLLLSLGAKHFDKSGIKSLKSSLISLKKLMGSEKELQADEKKEKQNSYRQNLMIRDLLKHCIDNIKDQLFKAKATNLLSCPKNKRWFGIRLFKLLNQNSWTKHEMLLLADELSLLREQKSVIGIKMRYMRSKLGRVQKNIRKNVQNGNTLSTQNESVNCEIGQQNEDYELQLKKEKKEIQEKFPAEQKHFEMQEINSMMNIDYDFGMDESLGNFLF